ncbi:hypothetical protein BGZ57DRAFT_853271 [Hyaloscypha finlandica]|nr:hypothetical protein BGZ57DRAFT_853271 [Hyaloscypha finlandica]
MGTIAEQNGWWRCCECQREVNPGFWGYDCPDCGATKCDACDDFSEGDWAVPKPLSGPSKIEVTSEPKVNIDEVAPNVGILSLSKGAMDSGSGESAIISAQASGSSKSSIRGPEGAGEQLASIIFEDDRLQPLWYEAVGKMPLDRLERNLGRLLKLLATDLQEEAVSVTERQLARFVRAEAKHSANLICKEIYANDELSEANEKALEGVSDGSDRENDDELANLQYLEKFLLYSLAFENFRTNLRQFVKPQLPSSVNKEDSERELLSTLPFAEVELGDILPEVTKNSYGLRSFLGSIIAMKNRLLMPPPLAKGIKRITWTCSCGEALYDDYEELESGAARRFQRTLRSNFSRQHTGELPAIHRPAHRVLLSFSSLPLILADFGRALYNKFLAKTVELPSFELRPQPQPSPPTAQQPSPTEQLYLLLCINDSRRLSTMRAHQPAVHNINSDKILFHMLQSYYVSIRKRWWSWVSLWELQKIYFVHFEMYENSLVDIRALDAIPPEDLSTSYNYERSKLKPPIGSNLLIHYLRCPEDASIVTPCFQRIPKKTKEKLIGYSVSAKNR